MSHLVIARKYRPQTFSDVVGQEQVTRTLANAVRRGKIGHAYLFSGPRGVGKTSIARIFSKALNCASGPTPSPCGTCSNCREIAEGRSIAVREIDGASHNSVDNVRELIDSFRSVPPPGSTYKVYIIDEVHMLSTAAFNALLKSLEEPPPHTVFILATTDVHKIPETVLSRCQRHDCRAFSADEIATHLTKVSHDEGIVADGESLRLIARLADGSMRDAQSLLERVRVFCDGPLTLAEVSTAVGAASRPELVKLLTQIVERRSAEALATAARLGASGVDSGVLLRDFVELWREALFARHGGADALIAQGVSPDDSVAMARLVAPLSTADVDDLVSLASQGCDNAVRSSHPRFAFEALVVRMATREPVALASEVLAELRSQRERGRGAPMPATRPTSPPPIAQRLSSEPVGSAPPPLPTAAGTEIDWGAFVAFAGERGAPVIIEQVKRLAVQRFVPGELVAGGPAFTLSYLKEGDNLAKLGELLDQFHKAPQGWRISLDGKGEQGESVRAREEKVRNERVAATKERVIEHPAVRALQEAFPGATIEKVIVKGEESV